VEPLLFNGFGVVGFEAVPFEECGVVGLLVVDVVVVEVVLVCFGVGFLLTMDDVLEVNELVVGVLLRAATCDITLDFVETVVDTVLELYVLLKL